MLPGGFAERDSDAGERIRYNEYMASLRISTNENRQVVDITGEVAKLVPAAGAGVVHVFVRHTTCALTTADLDPGTDLDLLDFLRGITPEVRWRHPHNPAHAPAHLLSSIIGPSVSVPFVAGELQLGTWQRIILLELDGPRNRELLVSILLENV